MAVYLISYDQHRDRDYTPIWTLLRSWSAARVLESVWLVTLDATPAAVREAIRRTTSNEDSVVVIQLTPGSEWAAYMAQAPGVQWLQAFVRAY